VSGERGVDWEVKECNPPSIDLPQDTTTKATIDLVPEEETKETSGPVLEEKTATSRSAVTEDEKMATSGPVLEDDKTTATIDAVKEEETTSPILEESENPALDSPAAPIFFGKESKGLGMSALKDYKRGDKIIVERPVVCCRRTERGNESYWVGQPTVGIQAALDSLSPKDGDFGSKYRTNSLSMGSDELGRGIFLHTARINHDCRGNAVAQFVPELKVMIVVASTYIAAGEEITICYSEHQNQEHRRFELKEWWGFDCECETCSDPGFHAKQEKLFRLTESVIALGRENKVPQALLLGKALVKALDENCASPLTYADMYFELYRIAIMKRGTFKDGVRYVNLALQNALLFYGPIECEEVKEIRKFVKNPASHRNFESLE
jgi:hypothetical protein